MKSCTFLPSAKILAAALVALTFLPREAGAADPQHPDISFAAHTLQETNVEGPDVERTYFMAAGKRIVFGLPKDCRLTVGDGFVLLPKETDGFDGEVRVTRSVFTPEADMIVNTLRYRDAAAEGMPKGANNVELQPPLLNPYPYNGWKSLGFTWNYSEYGRAMVRTVSYINLEVGVQITVTTLAAKQDAEKVSKIARHFMSSWWVMGG